MNEVKLALDLNKVVHDECKDVPHDIGLRLLKVVKQHLGEQLNLSSVIKWDSNEREPLLIDFCTCSFGGRTNGYCDECGKKVK